MLPRWMWVWAAFAATAVVASSSSNNSDRQGGGGEILGGGITNKGGEGRRMPHRRGLKKSNDKSTSKSKKSKYEDSEEEEEDEFEEDEEFEDDDDDNDKTEICSNKRAIFRTCRRGGGGGHGGAGYRQRQRRQLEWQKEGGGLLKGSTSVGRQLTATNGLPHNAQKKIQRQRREGLLPPRVKRNFNLEVANMALEFVVGMGSGSGSSRRQWLSSLQDCTCLQSVERAVLEYLSVRWEDSRGLLQFLCVAVNRFASSIATPREEVVVVQALTLTVSFQLHNRYEARVEEDSLQCSAEELILCCVQQEINGQVGAFCQAQGCNLQLCPNRDTTRTLQQQEEEEEDDDDNVNDAVLVRRDNHHHHHHRRRRGPKCNAKWMDLATYLQCAVKTTCADGNVGLGQNPQLHVILGANPNQAPLLARCGAARQTAALDSCQAFLDANCDTLLVDIGLSASNDLCVLPTDNPTTVLPTTPSPSAFPTLTPTMMVEEPTVMMMMSMSMSMDGGGVPTTSEPTLLPTATTTTTVEPTPLPSLAPTFSETTLLPTFAPTTASPIMEEETPQSLSFSMEMSMSMSLEVTVPTTTMTSSPTMSPTSVEPTLFPTSSIAPTSITFGSDRRTCIGVIDENKDAASLSNLETSWQLFRDAFALRPYCLLQPACDGATGNCDSFTAASNGDPFVASDLTIPENMRNDTLFTLAQVNRDNGNATLASDWFQLCNLDNLPNNIGKVALFIDVSGSMVFETIAASFALFDQKRTTAELEIISVENGDEDYILPFRTTLA